MCDYKNVNRSVILGSSWDVIRIWKFFFSLAYLILRCILPCKSLYRMLFWSRHLMYPSCFYNLYIAFLQGKKLDGSVNAYAINVSQKRKYRYVLPLLLCLNQWYKLCAWKRIYYRIIICRKYSNLPYSPCFNLPYLYSSVWISDLHVN